MMKEVAIGPASTFSLCLNMHECFSRVEVLGVQEVVDCAGVMCYWELEILVLLVLHLEVTEQGYQFLTEGGRQFAELLEDLLSGCYCMCYLEWHHCDGKSRCKDNGGGFGINKDVELSSRGPVSQSNCSSHYGDATDMSSDVRKSSQQDGQVSHCACHYELHWFWLSYKQLVDVQEGLLSDCFTWRLLQHCPLQSGKAVDRWCRLQLTTERIFSPTYDHNVIASDLMENIEGIASGVVDGRVASRGGDSKECERR